MSVSIKSIMLNSIYLNASDVAGASGLSPFIKPDEIVIKYKNRKAFEAEKFTSANEVIGEVLEQLDVSDETKNEFRLAKNEGEITTVTKKVVSQIAAKVASNPRLEDRDEELNQILKTIGKKNFESIESVLTSSANMTLGTACEKDILDTVEVVNTVKIVQRNTKIMYTSFEFGETTIRVGGKIDGFIEDEDTLIEAKTRTRRLLGFPVYEKVQCELYMRMKKVTRCKLIESFDGESATHIYESDPELVSQITRGLELFVDLYTGVSPSRVVVRAKSGGRRFLKK
jgi:hypothetical protein